MGNTKELRYNPKTLRDAWIVFAKKIVKITTR